MNGMLLVDSRRRSRTGTIVGRLEEILEQGQVLDANVAASESGRTSPKAIDQLGAKTLLDVEYKSSDPPVS